MIRGEEGPFEVKVAKNYVIFAGVGVFHTEAEVGDRSGKGPIRPKAFLHRAEDFSGLYVVRR